ncbi:MAG TPA: (deoxy)nucleoside triphosphate pyrophosphohydrolase [Burkholderiales bacterium]|nr:(deoxy)nucleoside triphosphate pyrophosphohydrolase [Burkholderiales bacterium]
MKDEAKPGTLRTVTAAVIERDGKVLVARRRQGIRFGGLWEFPGGKLERGEEPEKGLERELAEEFGIRTRVGELLCAVPFRSPTLSIELLAFRVEHVSGDYRPADHDEVCWLEPGEMDESVFTAPDRHVVRMLRASKAGAGEGDTAPPTPRKKGEPWTA